MMLDLHDIFLRHEVLVRERFLAAVEEARLRLRPLVAEAARRRDLSVLDRPLVALAMQLGEEVARTYLDAASATAAFLGSEAGTPVGVDTTHWRFTRALVDARTGLTQALVDDQRYVASLALGYAADAGMSHEDTVDWVLLLLGLSLTQALQVQRYHAQLHNLTPRRVLDDGEETQARSPTTPERARVMVRSYARRRLGERGVFVGEVEANRAVHRAQLDVVAQVVDARLLDAVQVVRAWFHVGDDKVRNSHRAMGGQVVYGYTTPFRSGLGNYLLYPGDPSAPIEDWAGCRCGVRVGIRS